MNLAISLGFFIPTTSAPLDNVLYGTPATNWISANDSTSVMSFHAVVVFSGSAICDFEEALLVNFSIILSVVGLLGPYIRVTHDGF